MTKISRYAYRYETITYIDNLILIEISFAAAARSTRTQDIVVRQSPGYPRWSHKKCTGLSTVAGRGKQSAVAAAHDAADNAGTRAARGAATNQRRHLL
jgi:hypothetical protein